MKKTTQLDKLKRLELSHMLRGIRTRNNPDKLNYHVAEAQNCRAKIDYINKEILK